MTHHIVNTKNLRYFSFLSYSLILPYCTSSSLNCFFYRVLSRVKKVIHPVNVDHVSNRGRNVNWIAHILFTPCWNYSGCVASSRFRPISAWGSKETMIKTHPTLSWRKNTRIELTRIFWLRFSFLIMILDNKIFINSA